MYWRYNPWKNTGISGNQFTPAARERRRFNDLVERLAAHLDDAAEVLHEMPARVRESAVLIAAEGPSGLVCLVPYYIGFDDPAQDRWYAYGRPEDLSLAAIGYIDDMYPEVLSGPSTYDIRSTKAPRNTWDFMSHVDGYRGIVPGSAFYFAQYIGMDALEEALDLAETMDWDEYLNYTRRLCKDVS